jgi:hypothetical protein
LFRDNKKHYNKNINIITNETKEHHNKYISIIDPDFKKGNDVNIEKIYDYIKDNILINGNKYKNNIKIEEKEGKYKNSGSNKRNHKNKIYRSTILYNM